MKQANKTQIEKARKFLENVELPHPPRTRRSSANNAKAVFDGINDHAIVVGGNIVSFADPIKSQHREVIVNSILLSQLAANRKVSDKEKIQEWYEVFFDTLTNIGWITVERGFSEHHESGNDFETNQAILSIASAVFGPASTALVVITTTLKSMKSMSAGPWMTVFKQESQTAKAARFQITAVEPDANGEPLISLMAFELEAKSNLVQVLFFKFHSNEATLRHASGRININSSLLSNLAPAISEKVAAFSTIYIQNLPI